jgi:hypothetical protein
LNRLELVMLHLFKCLSNVGNRVPSLLEKSPPTLDMLGLELMDSSPGHEPTRWPTWDTSFPNRRFSGLHPCYDIHSAKETAMEHPGLQKLEWGPSPDVKRVKRPTRTSCVMNPLIFSCSSVDPQKNVHLVIHHTLPWKGSKPKELVNRIC